MLFICEICVAFLDDFVVIVDDESLFGGLKCLCVVERERFLVGFKTVEV